MRRFRSCGISALNKEDYLKKINEIEGEYIEESTLSYITLISLDEKNINNEYEFLGTQSNYKIKNCEKIKKRKKRKNIISKQQYFKNKIFFHHKRNRLNYESINMISP